MAQQENPKDWVDEYGYMTIRELGNIAAHHRMTITELARSLSL